MGEYRAVRKALAPRCHRSSFKFGGTAAHFETQFLYLSNGGNSTTLTGFVMKMNR